MKETNFYQLFIDQLKDVYDNELELVKNLPKMAQAATNSKLKEAFENHWKETKDQVIRLDQIAAILKIDLSGEKCAGMRGILEECEETIKKHYENDVKDCALIACAQRVEHYEIAAYGVLCAFAKHLNYESIEKLLKETEREEAHADKTLTKIAEGSIFKKGINTAACKKKSA